MCVSVYNKCEVVAKVSVKYLPARCVADAGFYKIYNIINLLLRKVFVVKEMCCIEKL